MDLDLLFGLSLIGLSLVVPIAVRWARERAVAALMRAQSAEGTADGIAETPSPTPEATRYLRFDERDASSAGPDAQAAWARHEWRARARVRQGYGLNLRMAVLYGAVVAIAAFIGDPGWSSELLQGIAAVIGFYFLVFPLLRYFYYRKQFSPLHFKVGFRAQHPFDAVAEWVLGPDHEGYVLSAFLFLVVVTGWQMLAAQEPMYFAGAGLCFAALVHVAAAVRFMRRGHRHRNLKLTVLRVFGQDGRVALTFGGALRFWSHFGSYFTIVDPTLVRHRGRLISWSSIGTIAWLFVAWVALMAASMILFKVSPTEWTQEVDIAILYVAATTVALFAYWKTRLGFAGSEAAIASRINRLLARPRMLGSTFKSLTLACFSNTWGEAVRQFVRRSDAVLMDLRGMSGTNKGCADEVDFLFDRYPVGRILFLVDHESDRAPVERIIRERWASIREDSPNCGLADPVAMLFVVNDGKATDMQALLEVLLHLADPRAARVKQVP